MGPKDGLFLITALPTHALLHVGTARLISWPFYFILFIYFKNIYLF